MIRVAETDDVGNILSLLMLRHRESSAWRGEFNAALLHGRILALLEPGRRAVIGVIDDGGVRATCALVVAQFWDTGLEHIEPLWMFVHPDFRRTDHMKNLVAFAKGMANALRLPLIGVDELPVEVEGAKLFGRTQRKAASIKIPGQVYRHSPEETVNA